jgi:hypothetical protein
MIYLIDDKKDRQGKYNWKFKKLNEFRSILFPIWRYEEMKDENTRREIFSSGNIICFHESFFKNPLNKSNIDEDFNLIRERIDKFVHDNANSYVIYFSGSISNRIQTDNICYMPVSLFYRNLEIYLENFTKNDKNINYLLYGKNPNLEKEIREKYVRSVNDIDYFEYKNPIKLNYFIQQNTIKPKISNPLKGVKELFLENLQTDSEYIQKVNEWFSEETYDNIFIPLCFGSTFSDFNGLRLATLIRCIPTKNQTSRIFIYSFLSTDYVLDNPFFNILKTKNVQLIPFSKKAFAEFADKMEELLTKEELSTELEKLKLDVPGDYFDSHHIANEWGIYQMARNAGLKIEDIEGFEYDKLNSIYFKWLIAKNNLYEELPEDQIKQLKDYSIKLPGLNVKGKIDLDKIPKR